MALYVYSGGGVTGKGNTKDQAIRAWQELILREPQHPDLNDIPDIYVSEGGGVLTGINDVTNENFATKAEIENAIDADTDA